MDKKELCYGSYILYAVNGKKIRKATIVRNSRLGWTVRFIDILPKKQAFEQAIKIWSNRREGLKCLKI